TEGEALGARDRIDPDDGESDAEHEGHEPLEHGIGDHRGGGDEGEERQGEELGRAEARRQVRQRRGDEDDEEAGDEAAEEGAKRADRPASAGAEKAARKRATNPPMNAPIAAVARACGARPSLAILWPSKVEAIAEACPGVFMRMAIVESPKSPPK